MKKLIINADDLGLTPGVTRGIIEAHLNGIVTSTSAMMNSPHISAKPGCSQSGSPRPWDGRSSGAHLGQTLAAGEIQFPRWWITRAIFSNSNSLPSLFQLSIWTKFAPNGRRKLKPSSPPGAGRTIWTATITVHTRAVTCSRSCLNWRGSMTCPSATLPNRKDDSLRLNPLEEVLAQSSVRSPQTCITSFYEDGVSIAQSGRNHRRAPGRRQRTDVPPGIRRQELIEGSSYTTARETGTAHPDKPRNQSVY